MTDENAFIEYWYNVDFTMAEVYGVDTTDVGINPDEIAAAQENLIGPEEFVRCCAKRYRLNPCPEWIEWEELLQEMRQISVHRQGRGS